MERERCQDEGSDGGFYKNLRRGGLKDEALRQAKLDYLKRNKGQAAHPFYWAGFIGIGDMAPVRK